MAQSYREAEQKKEARKLRELFKGRFSDEEAQQLLREQGCLGNAVDFILNSDPEQVRRFIHDRNEALVDSLRSDSAYVHSALTQGLEASIRLFACQGCDNYWWRKMPARKEVSRCKLCKKKYDPVPREQEWGLAEFVCGCGNVFRGSGWMNHTQSPCYECQCLTCPTRILPPTKPRQQKKRTVHSCTGANCYNRAVPLGPYDGPAVPAEGGARGSRGGERGGRRGRGYQRGGDGFGGGYYDPGDDDGFNLCADHRNMCSHERSYRRRKVLYPSTPHVSTGSTVNTFMSQGELAEVYDDLQSLPNTIPEADGC